MSNSNPVSGSMRINAVLLFIALASACVRTAPAVRAASDAPSFVLGTFQDDYGERHTITPNEWLQQPRNRYHIVLSIYTNAANHT